MPRLTIYIHINTRLIGGAKPNLCHASIILSLYGIGSQPLFAHPTIIEVFLSDDRYPLHDTAITPCARTGLWLSSKHESFPMFVVKRTEC